MEFIRRNDLGSLLESTNSPAVSVYIPLEQAGREVRQNSIRLKNLLGVAERSLRDVVNDGRIADRLLRPGFALVEGGAAWNPGGQAVAIFLAPSEFHCWLLPVKVKESVTVGGCFYMRPLLSAIDREMSFYLMALSHNAVRLYEVSQHEIAEVTIPDLPRSIAETLNYTAADRGAQVHSASSSGRDKQAAVFHGHGGAAEMTKDDLRSYFRQIDAVVVRETNKRPAPLMLACVDSLVAIYRDITRLPNVLEEHLGGNPEHFTRAELHKRVWPLFDAEYCRKLDANLARLTNSLKSDHATAKTSDIVLAASDGRVDSLFLDAEREVWGLCQYEERVVDVHDIAAESDRELIELAAVETMRHGGAVHCVAAETLPTAAPMAAILRFS